MGRPNPVNQETVERIVRIYQAPEGERDAMWEQLGNENGFRDAVGMTGNELYRYSRLTQDGAWRWNSLPSWARSEFSASARVAVDRIYTTTRTELNGSIPWSVAARRCSPNALCYGTGWLRGVSRALAEPMNINSESRRQWHQSPIQVFRVYDSYANGRMSRRELIETYKGHSFGAIKRCASRGRCMLRRSEAMRQ